MQKKEMTDIPGSIGSKEYKRELKYWSELVKKYGKYSRFFNVKGGECGAVKVNADGQKIRAFLSEYGFSAFEFYASAFALYLMRTDRVGGCLINTVITGDETGEYKKTLLKTDTKKEDTFTDLLKSFRQGFSEAVNNTSVDIKHYLKSPVSYYSVYDMTVLGRSFAKDSDPMDAVALYVDGDQVNLSYNKDHFSDEFAAHMAANIESLIGNLINEPEISLTAVNILSADEKELLSTYCKGEEFPVDEDRVLSLAFREYALIAPDAMAVNDGVNKVTYGELEFILPPRYSHMRRGEDQTAFAPVGFYADNYTSKVRMEGETALYSYARPVQGGAYEIRVNYHEYYVYRHAYVLKDGIGEPYFLFGTTNSGQDLFTCLASGARFSFVFAILVAVVNLAVGAVWGAIAGYYGGRTDLIMERITDILSAVPFMIVITLLKYHFSNGNNHALLLFISFIEPPAPSRPRFRRMRCLS